MRDMRNLRLSWGKLTAIGCYTNLFIFVTHDTHDTHFAPINLFTHDNCVYAVQPVILVVLGTFCFEFVYASQLFLRSTTCDTDDTRCSFCLRSTIRDTRDTQFTLLKSGYAS